MKLLLYFLVPLCVLASCKKSESDNQVPPQNKNHIYTDISTLTLHRNAGAYSSFSIQTNIDWIITISETWLKVSTTSGTGNATIQITVLEANNNSSSRSATITITPVGDTSIVPINITVIQNPINFILQWSKLYGGTKQDGAASFIELPDSSVVVAGRSESSNGDVSGHNGNFDAWLFKLDGNGKKLWSKLYGGMGSDGAYSIIATPDGGFIVAGYAYSNDGDVSGNQGWGDVWIMKLDANGNMTWSKLYGGTNDETATSIITTTDGGFLIAATTESNDGDVSGNHGDFEAWVMKIIKII